MARIRTIKPEFPQSESVGRLSRDARLLFIQLWTIVDDSSRARASSRLLASLLYPYDNDAGELMGGWLDELQEAGKIRVYVIDGTTYLDIPSWLKHQKIDRPSVSRIPEFDDAQKQGGGDHRGGAIRRALDERSTSPREDTSNTREPSRALDAGPRTVDLGSRTVDRTTTAPKPAASEPTQGEPAVLQYPCQGKGVVWALIQPQIDTWANVLPSTDVLGECRKAHAWLEANFNRRKTARGMPKFLFGWLNRATPQQVATTQTTYRDEPEACTCGDSYRNSFGRRCVDCEGEPSPAQLDAVR